MWEIREKMTKNKTCEICNYHDAETTTKVRGALLQCCGKCAEWRKRAKEQASFDRQQMNKAAAYRKQFWDHYYDPQGYGRGY